MKKLKKIFQYLINNVKPEDGIIFALVLGVFVTLLKQYSNILTSKDYAPLISVIAVSLAYAAFFVNYQKNMGREADKRRIKYLVDGLFISSFFPIITVLFIGEDIGFGAFDKFIAYTFVVLVTASLFIISFCVIELWVYIVKNFFK